MSNTNGHMPAMPQSALELLGKLEPIGVKSVLDSFGGLTKREHFAAMAMQGLLSNNVITDHEDNIAPNWVAKAALLQADTLLKALEES